MLKPGSVHQPKAALVGFIPKNAAKTDKNVSLWPDAVKCEGFL